MLRLRGLEPEAAYEIENVDTVERYVRSGASLMQEGLPVHLPEPESAAVLLIRKRAAGGDAKAP
jgi:hypothetical protein